MTMKRGAFTLVELIAVMAILAVVSATAIPALGAMQSSRNTAVAREVERQVCLARAYAMATGQPAGLTISAAANSLTLVRIASAAATPTPMPDALGQSRSAMLLGQVYTGASIASFVNGDGGATNTTIWFTNDGVPHLRDANGLYTGPFTADALVTVSGPLTVTIRRSTGEVER